ncbi:MAG: M6 family metalloprotease domain-containing protein [Muribaculaceae bacterium]|nr:M6 family metalloprotease domain-containing protein [Muribaculaceae bacterium]
MKFHSRLLISSMMLSCGLSLLAVPAKRDVRTVTQPDGTTLRIKLVGDEFHHFVLTEDDMLLSQAPDGTYCYATINAQGILETTGVKALDKAVRSVVPQQAMSLKDVDLKKVQKSPKRIPQTGVGLDVTTFPGKGSPNVLILLVEYSDVKFTVSNPAEYYNNMLNQKGFSEYGATGSCKDYFDENSQGQFTPIFHALGPVTLANKQRYYGGNDMWGNDRYPEEMVVEGIKALDKDVDFSIYDNDGDGILDNVYVIYAGRGEASGGSDDTVWPHSYDLENTGKDFVVDGVRVNHYACSNEWEGSQPDGIGTFVHEFSHVMGLPDLYTTDYNSAQYDTPGAYSVLDYGPYNNEGRTPPAYSIYERNSLGWCEPEMIEGPLNGSMEHILSSNAGYIIPTSKNNEFFLLENRQQKGWDEYIPGHGMLIWHIDFNQSVWSQNEVNNTKNHQYVDIEEACNSRNNDDEELMAGYTFPGSQNVTSFTDDTTPSMKTWSNARLNLPITDIAETDGVITFLVAGGDDGTPPVKVPVPFAVEDIEKSAEHFVAAWAPVENAVDYEVTVSVGSSGEKVTSVNEMGAQGKFELPEGWTSSSTQKYDSYGNYGESSPSLKMAADGVWLLSPLFTGDVSAISYWRKAQGTSGDSSLELQGLINGEWVTLNTQALPANDDGKKISMNNVRKGVKQVKFIYHKDKGNCALDDVVIQVGGGDEFLPDYIDCSTGGATSLRIDKLKEGARTYSFKVRAIGEGKSSAYCSPVEIELPEPAGINGVNADNAKAEYFDLLGRRVLNPTSGQILIRRQGANVTKEVIR